ncbi:hypothetical protein Tco_0044273 [Tanacetum coccineum]
MEYLHEKFRNHHHHHDVDEMTCRDDEKMRLRRNGVPCHQITLRFRSLFKGKRTHDSINNVINAIVEVRICFHDVSIKTSQEHTIWKDWRFRAFKSPIEANVCEETLDVVGFVVGLINNTTFVNVAIFNGFVEFGNCGGNARDFGYFWDVGFGEGYIGGSSSWHFVT